MAKKVNKQWIRSLFSKIKKGAANILKACWKISLPILKIASLVSFLAVPFLHNCIDHALAQWIWYPACLIFVISAILDFRNPTLKPSKIPLFDFLGKLSLLPATMILGSAFVINYYDSFCNWWWAGAIIFAVCFPAFMLGIRKHLEKEKSYTSDQIKKSQKNCWKYILFYWLIDLFYVSIFNYWQAEEQLRMPWLILQFVFGGLAMVYIFYNLARAFLANGEKHWWGLLQDFLWGISLSVYLIFLIPNTNNLQNIVIQMTAAIYGGLLTLVGVAWTIKDTNNKRIEDQQRIEDERKKEDRKQHRPVVHVFAGNYGGPKHDIDVMSWVKDTDNISKTPTAELTVANIIHECYFGNTDFSNVYVWGIKINGYITRFSSIRYIKRENYFLLNFTNKPLYTAEPMETISLIFEDVLGNLYELPLEFSFSPRFNCYIIRGNNPSFYIGDAKEECDNE